MRSRSSLTASANGDAEPGRASGCASGCRDAGALAFEHPAHANSTIAFFICCLGKHDSTISNASSSRSHTPIDFQSITESLLTSLILFRNVNGLLVELDRIKDWMPATFALAHVTQPAKNRGEMTSTNGLKRTLAGVCLVVGLGGCGLINVNGKPLTLGSSSANTAAPTSETASSTANTEPTAAEPAESPTTTSPTPQFDESSDLETQDYATFTGPIGQYGNMPDHCGEAAFKMDQLGNTASMWAQIGFFEACVHLGRDTSKYESLEFSLLGAAILSTQQPLDSKKAQAEIAANKSLNKHSRTDLQKRLTRDIDAFNRAKAEIAALAKTEPAVAKMVAIAEQEFRNWSTRVPARDALVARLAALEAVENSKKNSELAVAADCRDTTGQAWRAYLAGLKLPAVSAGDQLEQYFYATVTGVDGYLTYAALATCLKIQTKVERGQGGPRKGGPSNRYVDFDGTLLKRFLGTAETRRGPRTSIAASWISANPAIVFDDRSKKLGTLLVNAEMVGGGVGESTPVKGVIASVSDGDGGTVVTFKKVLVDAYECTAMRTTDRIWYIRPSGDVEYHRECTASKKSKRDDTPEPMAFDKTLALGLAPGMLLIATTGLPIVATSSVSSTKPVFVLGGKL